ncbi:MAG TPA: VTT domain-containing protein [Terriglobia bacterium]|nr:VTT domain-containing protein [Terriglobia bacterium]
MREFFSSIFTLFLSPGGLVILAALDSSMFFFMPGAMDAAVVILTAQDPGAVWLYPILAAAGSVGGVTVTFAIGREIGEKGLPLWISERRLRSIQKKIESKGAFAVAAAGAMPPPFPMTPFVLACGALGVNRLRFLAAFAVARTFRFGVVAWLAMLYGDWVLTVIRSEGFKTVVMWCVVAAIGGTVYSGYRIWQSVRRNESRRSKRS